MLTANYSNQFVLCTISNVMKHSLGNNSSVTDSVSNQVSRLCRQQTSKAAH